MSNMNLTWEDLGESESKYIKFNTNDAVHVIFTNWRLYRCEHPIRKDGSMTIRFTADVVNQDGTENGKQLDSLSMRLIKSLRPLLEGLEPSSIVEAKIVKIGEGMNTNYKVFDFKVMERNGSEKENNEVEVIHINDK